MKYIRGTYLEAEPPELGAGEAIRAAIPADPNVKNYTYTVVDGQVYYRENSLMVRPDLSAVAEARVRGMVSLRTACGSSSPYRWTPPRRTAPFGTSRPS